LSGSAPVCVKAVLLDAFGTLITLENPVGLLRVLLRERLGVEVSDAQAAAAFAAEVAFNRAHMHLGRDAESLAELHRRCAQVLRARLPQEPLLVSASDQAITAVLVDSLRFRVYPEVPETLARLRGAGLRLVVVSNWDASLDQVLVRVGLRSALDGVISSAVVGAAKPDPLPFQRGLELAGAAAHEAVHVGDSETEDVSGALGAGITPMLLRRGSESSVSEASGSERGDRGKATITSLAELPPLLHL
jgi:putative hydrolase of the HAD superfamily